MRILVINIKALDAYNEKHGTCLYANDLTDEQFAEINEEFNDGWSFDGVEDLVDAINCERGVPNPNSDYVRIIREPQTFFPITSVSRDDLETKGFDASGVDDATMETLARKMSDAYVGDAFWTDLDIIAESLGIPKKS